LEDSEIQDNHNLMVYINYYCDDINHVKEKSKVFHSAAQAEWEGLSLRHCIKSMPCRKFFLNFTSFESVLKEISRKPLP